IVRMGRAIYDTLGNMQNGKPTTYSVTLRTRTEQNPYTAELAAIAMAMRCLPLFLVGRQITIFTSSQSTLLTVSQPRNQSSQISIGQVYNTVHTLRKRGNRVLISWVP